MSDIIESIIDVYKLANEGKILQLSSVSLQETEDLTTKTAFISSNANTLFEDLNTSTENQQPSKLVNDDPFAKFIDKFKSIINEAKEKEPTAIVQKEIKTKTLELISKLKEGVSIKKQLPEKFNKSKHSEPSNQSTVEKIQVLNLESEEDLNKESSTTSIPEKPSSEDKSKKKNSYVEQLRALDKEKKKSKQPTDIKSLIDSKVKEAVEVLHKQLMNAAMGGSGGGTNAVQFAQGGTMRGDLNVTGKYLSGGVDLKDIFGSGGGGLSDRLTAGTKTLILNSDGTVSFPDDVIKTENDTSLTIESENVALSAFTQIVVSPYTFVIHDNNQNSISFDTIDNTFVITTNGVYEWKFNDQGDVIGPGGVLTVDGSFDVSNHLLSGGRNLDEIFLTAETDAQTLSWNSSAYQLSISNGNTISLSSLSAAPSVGREDVNTLVVESSANWNATFTNLVSNSAAYLSGVDLTFLQQPSSTWDATFTTVQSNSSNWQNAYETATVYQSNSGTYATTSYVDSNFLALSGGTLTGNLSVYGSTYINNNLTIGGSLTALGTATFANTIFTTTSAISVVNTGPGPALYVYQAAGPYDVASFYDGDGVEVLHVGNANPNGLGRVGINESFPNEELTVRGSISATETIYVSGGNSIQWNEAYTNLVSNSAAYLSGVDLTFLSVSGDWNTAYQNVSSQSLNTTDDVQFNQINANIYLSGGINLFNLLSSSGGGGDPAVNTVVYQTSATWDNTTTIVQNNSASWFEPVRRFDYVTVANIDYSYSGTAPYGTIEINPIWKLTRLTYNNNGTVSNTASAIDSWTGRLTATYV